MSHDMIATTDKPSRLFYLDHLRAFLVILVVLHHVALVYGAAAPFYYAEPPFTDPRAYQVFLIFVLTNQSFFMGVLFLLSGYFTPGSFDRKSTSGFIKDKLLRLGIPLLVYIFVFNPISSIGFYLMPPELTGITSPLTWDRYPDFLHLGPLWFVAMLLVFNFGYIAWRRLRRKVPKDGNSKPISAYAVVLFVLVLAAASFLTRMVVPLGKSIGDFPTLAYLPQYLSFFILGAIAYRRNWLTSLPKSAGIAAVVAAVMAFVFLFPLAISGRMFSFAITPEMAIAFGGTHWRSAVYALFDSSFAVSICLALTLLFRQLFNGKTRIGTFLASHSYGVYILHIPLVVFITYSIRGIDLGSLLKFALASLITVPACFIVTYLVKKIPGVSKII